MLCAYSVHVEMKLDLDFIDLTYARKKEIAKALAEIGFTPRDASRYFERAGCQWAIEFPPAPLAIGQQQITRDRVEEMHTTMGKIRLLNPTDCVKDRLLWWYLEKDGQCWEQAVEVARGHNILWKDLQSWHEAEGYADQFDMFRVAVNA